ncbi:MAG: carbohydrate kinase, partial [Clostridia bacterium]|nr:carbohydrate kinase [Clostridia bacterium]
MKYLSIDVGTTRCKCQLFDNEGNILEYIAKDYEFKKVSGELYVDVDAIIKNVKNMIKAVAVKHEINSVAVSSFGESFVLLDKDDNVLFYPMLYTDVRGEEQAKRVAEIFGNEKLFKVTGITAHSMYSLYKLLWIKENYPEVYKRADKV